MGLELFIVIFLLTLLFTQSSLVGDIYELKGYRHFKGILIGLIPVYGMLNALRLEGTINVDPAAMKKILRFKGIINHWFQTILMLLLFAYLVFPIYYLVRVKWFGMAEMASFLFWGYVIIELLVLWFTHSSVCGEINEKKGYSKTKGALIGLIPIYGLIVIIKRPNLKQMFRGGLRNIIGVREVASKIITFLWLMLSASVVLFPIVYLVGASFSNTSELPSTFLPNSALFTWNNYVRLFDETNFKTWYGNTFIIAILSMVLGVIFITGAGYVFARFKFKGKKAGLMGILVLQVFPSFMGLVAMFTLFQVFGLLGKPTALTILYVGGSVPGNIWLIKGYLSQIPKDLDESAMLDGASKAQIFFKIILPLSVPILSFVAVGQFMAPWMDYMLPKYLLDVQLSSTSGVDTVSKQWTLAVGLFSMISSPQSTSYTMFAAGSLIVAVPITILYMLFQRFLIEGITAGATKG